MKKNEQNKYVKKTMQIIRRNAPKAAEVLISLLQSKDAYVRLVAAIVIREYDRNGRRFKRPESST